MRKIEKDGKVAVLHSLGFGAGWYTWNTRYPQMLYDPLIVEWVLAGKPNNHLLVAVNEHISTEYPGAYTGGMSDLEVEWLPVATRFRINEYDGSERVVFFNTEDWHTA